VVEGVGGWRVPLDAHGTTIAGLAQRLGLPVILVIGMRLGCLNHALLTAESIARTGLRFAGWVANEIESQMPLLADNIRFLAEALAAPLLAHIPPLSAPAPAAISKCLDLASLLAKKP